MQTCRPKKGGSLLKQGPREHARAVRVGCCSSKVRAVCQVPRGRKMLNVRQARLPQSIPLDLKNFRRRPASRGMADPVLPPAKSIGSLEETSSRRAVHVGTIPSVDEFCSPSDRESAGFGPRLPRGGRESQVELKPLGAESRRKAVAPSGVQKEGGSP